ncbi:MAG TPA: hypothetical protein VJI68_00775 [Candidatus Nanoarchaeia archaeon]|nr:hypothetical protein [Candidatus Nanoarchaeia archaeon]
MKKLLHRPYEARKKDLVVYPLNSLNLNGSFLIDSLITAVGKPWFKSEGYSIDVRNSIDVPTNYASNLLQLISSRFVDRPFVHPELGSLSYLSDEFRSVRIGFNPKYGSRAWTSETFLSVSSSYSRLGFYFYNAEGFNPSKFAKLLGLSRVQPLRIEDPLFDDARAKFSSLVGCLNNVVEDTIRDAMKQLTKERSILH